MLRRVLSSLTAAAVGALAVAAPTAARAEPSPAPALLSIATDPGPYDPGEVVRFVISIANVAQATSVEAVIAEKSTAWRDVMTAQWTTLPTSGAGVLEFTVPTSEKERPYAGIPYRVERIVLRDEHGGMYEYHADGSFTSTVLPWGTHDASMSTDLTFLGEPRDVSPPVLEDLAWSTQDMEVSEALTVSYRARDEHLRQVLVWAIDRDRTLREMVITVSPGTSGSLPPTGSFAWSPPSPSVLTVWAVQLTDAAGNAARYYPSGRLTTGTPGNVESFVSTHDVSMPAPLTIRPDAVSGLTARVGAGSVTLGWSQKAHIEHRVAITPGGRQLVGLSADAERVLEVPELDNGTAYTFVVTTQQNGIESRPVSVGATPRMGATRVFGTGDKTKDGRPDLMAAPAVTDPSSTATWRVYKGAGAGRFAGTVPTSVLASRAPIPGATTARGPGAAMGALHLQGNDLVEPTPTGSKVVGKGFTIFRTIDASSDLTSDGIADLIGITPAGEFYVYPSTSTGAIGRGVRLGSGWSAFQSVFSPGDFTGDTRSDVVAVDATGRLWLYPGNGRGGFGARVQLGSGWGTFGAVLALRDFSGDGKVDIGAITTDGRLRMYPGNGRGGFSAASQIGTGWRSFL